MTAISPIIAGGVVKGPANRMMKELGLEPTVIGVARLYADICGTLIIDTKDADLQQDVEREGMKCIVTNTLMDDVEIARSLARVSIGMIT